MDVAHSNQLRAWKFNSLEELDKCRVYTNYKARVFLAQRSKTSDPQQDTSSTAPAIIPVSHYACKDRAIVHEKDYAKEGPWQSTGGSPFINAAEEQLLVNFYLNKMPLLIGPSAQVRRLRRDSKVLATSAMLYRRFFVSNSVLLFDPKAILVAAAFLGSKVEDSMAQIHHLEEGIVSLNDTVSTQEIMAAELALISGVNFDLLCFHPYKAVVSLTEDLRTFLKTSAGVGLTEQRITGQDLKPLYDKARAVLEDTVVSDLNLLFSPSQIGMAALMSASDKGGPKIDFQQYLKARFANQPSEKLAEKLPRIATLLSELKEGKHGCGNHGIKVDQVKRVHKQLKKVRAWGEPSSKKGSKKRKMRSLDGSEAPEPDTKREKTES